MKHEDGFAMADAIIALTILSTLLTSVMGLNSAAFDASRKARTRLTAALVAKALIADPSIRTDQGTFTIDRTKYDWRRQKTPRQTAREDIVTVSDITITVEWQVKSGLNQISLHSAEWNTRHAN